MEGLQFLMSFTCNLLAYLAFGVFVVGIILRTYHLKKTPIPYKIPQTPQSTSLGGVVSRMTSDVLVFRSLSKSETARILWIAGWLFHIGFLLVILRHLRYFTYPVPGWVMLLQGAGIIAGVVMLIALLVLFFRRYTNERVRYVTTFADRFVLLLIILIVASGLSMKFIFRPDLVQIKDFLLGVVFLHPTDVPLNWLFITHFMLVMILLIYFPFSKLIHAVGYFLSPTRNMINNPRTKRHINPWDDEAWEQMVKGVKVIDPQTNEPYQPWSAEQWRKKWQTQ